MKLLIIFLALNFKACTPHDSIVDVHIEMYNEYKSNADKVLSKYESRSIEGYMLADAYINCYKKYGIEVPLGIALAQAQLETRFGKGNPNNPYNIRSKKSGYNLFSSPQEGINRYYEIMCTKYLNCKSYEQLLHNFTSCKGYRYAESPTYESALRKVIASYNLK